MTPKAFESWLAEMKAAGLAKTKTEAARLLGIHQNSIKIMLTRGADQRTALACRALLHRLEPYKTENPSA